MARYVALLRGINVGGNNLIKMAALKDCFGHAMREAFGAFAACDLGRRPAVSGRLIKHAVAADRLGECRRIGLLRHLKRIEAGPQHEQELIPQDLAGCAQFARKVVLLAQQARLAEGTAVLEHREHESDQGESVEIRRKLDDAPVVGPDHAGRGFAPQQRRVLGQQPAVRHDRRNVRRDRRVVGNADETVRDDPSVLNEPHRRAP